MQALAQIFCLACLVFAVWLGVLAVIHKHYAASADGDTKLLNSETARWMFLMACACIGIGVFAGFLGGW